MINATTRIRGAVNYWDLNKRDRCEGVLEGDIVPGDFIGRLSSLSIL